MRIIRYDRDGRALPVSYLPRPLRILQNSTYVEARDRIIARLVADQPVLDAEIGDIVRHRRATRAAAAQAHVRKVRKGMVRRLSIGLTQDHHGKPLGFGIYHRARLTDRPEGLWGVLRGRRKTFVWTVPPTDQQILDETGYTPYVRTPR